MNKLWKSLIPIVMIGVFMVGVPDIAGAGSDHHGHKHDKNCNHQTTKTTAPTTVPEDTTTTTTPDLPGEVIVPDKPRASVPDQDVPYTITRETPEITPYVGVPHDSPVKGAPISFTG